MLVCDLHPFCQSQGCESDPADCKRVRDLRGGVDKRPDLMPRRTAAAFKLSLKPLDDVELFGRWSIEYDAKRFDFASLVIEEMGTRNPNIEVIAL